MEGSWFWEENHDKEVSQKNVSTGYERATTLKALQLFHFSCMTRGKKEMNSQIKLFEAREFCLFTYLPWPTTKGSISTSYNSCLWPWK
jgi:hypothetical protein